MHIMSVWVYWCFTSHATIFQLYMWRHRCAGGLKKKLYLRSGSQRHRHFVWFFYVPVLHRHGPPFLYAYSEKPSHLLAFNDTLGIRRAYSHFNPPPFGVPTGHLIYQVILVELSYNLPLNVCHHISSVVQWVLLQRVAVYSNPSVMNLLHFVIIITCFAYLAFPLSQCKWNQNMTYT